MVYIASAVPFIEEAAEFVRSGHYLHAPKCSVVFLCGFDDPFIYTCTGIIVFVKPLLQNIRRALVYMYHTSGEFIGTRKLWVIEKF